MPGVRPQDPTQQAPDGAILGGFVHLQAPVAPIGRCNSQLHQRPKRPSGCNESPTTFEQPRNVGSTTQFLRECFQSIMGEISPAPDNLLNRDFSAAAPNAKWLTDITEFQIPAGKVYLSPMIDCFDGMVVSWSIGTRPNAELVDTMLDAAIDKVATSAERPVVHSDRGGHYRWPGWLSRIAGAQLIRSMSRKGCSPDNAACEGFFGRLNIEMFFARDWISTTVEVFVAAVAPTSAGTTRRGSRSRSAASAPPHIAEAWGSLFNQSKFLSAPPVGQFSVGVNILWPGARLLVPGWGVKASMSMRCMSVPMWRRPTVSPSRASWRSSMRAPGTTDLTRKPREPTHASLRAVAGLLPRRLLGAATSSGPVLEPSPFRAAQAALGRPWQAAGLYLRGRPLRVAWRSVRHPDSEHLPQSRRAQSLTHPRIEALLSQER